MASEAKIIVRREEDDLAISMFETSESAMCVIGRATDCNVIIPKQLDSRISRHHCLLEINPPQVLIKDLGSKNGTFVNGEDIRDLEVPVPLMPADDLRIGATRIQVQFRGIEPPPRTATCTKCGRQKIAKAPSVALAKYLCDACRERTEEVPFDSELFDSVDVDSPVPGYRVIRPIGRGGVAEVYLAMREDSRIPVALKVLRTDVAFDPKSKNRFMREAENLRLLNHPHIVGLKGAGGLKECLFIAMEYCNAGPLPRLILGRESPMLIDDAIHITCQLLDALEYAHQVGVPGHETDAVGVVHRDIKPGNVLLHYSKTEERQLAKLADFGLAKAYGAANITSFTQTGTVGGTLDYMCRQQLLDYKHAGPAADVWSTAAILYYMLTREPPRAPSDIKNPLLRVLETGPLPILKRRNDIPKPLAKLIDHALDEKKELRFQTAAEFQTALLELKL